MTYSVLRAVWILETSGQFWAHRGEKINEGASKVLQIAKHRVHRVKYRP